MRGGGGGYRSDYHTVSVVPVDVVAVCGCKLCFCFLLVAVTLVDIAVAAEVFLKEPLTRAVKNSIAEKSYFEVFWIKRTDFSLQSSQRSLIGLTSHSVSCSRSIP